MDDERYATVRDPEILGSFIGARLMDVTQQDADEYAERGTFVCFHFDNGRTVTVPIGDEGFCVELEEDADA